MNNMLYIIWSDTYATGIPILDEQLRGLVSLINSFFFHRNDAHGDIEKVLVPTAEMFKNYLRINFYTVEKLMEESGYPNLELYRRKHRKILEVIVHVDKQARANRDAGQFLSVLKKYWLRSVQLTSANYVAYLRAYYETQNA